MAWTTPINLATGDKVTDAIWNLQVIDNLIYLHSDHYLSYADQKASGTAGGTFTQGAWRTRDLNTERNDSSGLGTLLANQITLQAGTYLARWACEAYAVDSHQSKLYNVTAVSDLILGVNARALSANLISTCAVGMGKFTLTVPSVLELRHWCQTTKATDGFGNAVSTGTVETYSLIEFWYLS